MFLKILLVILNCFKLVWAYVINPLLNGLQEKYIN